MRKFIQTIVRGKALLVFKNFYWIVGLLFLMWMSFLDSNDLLYRFRISSKMSALKAEKIYYQQKIREVTKDRNELMTNPDLLEKFAREKYLMKKDKEDVFVLQKEE